MTTSPEPFHRLHLGRCRSTSDYIKKNLPALAGKLPLMVSAGAQTAGRGREGRGWFSAPGQGLYATFAFTLADQRSLPLLSITAGVAVADALAPWSGLDFSLKWPNDVLAGGKKIAGILCENMVAGERITCLVGIGINVNQRQNDFPAALRERAASLRMQSGRAWPLAAGRDRLAEGMAVWMGRLRAGEASAILERARFLGRPFLGREISFHHQGRIWRGLYCGLADDGGLQLEMASGVMQVFYSGEIGEIVGGIRP